MNRGEKITIVDGQLVVPACPIVTFIEGDGTGPCIWKASQPVINAAVAKAYGGTRRIDWLEIYAGEKAFRLKGEWLPSETMELFREYTIGIKGPLATPVGNGISSLNVAFRQQADLYACVRPVRHFPNVPTPVREPQAVNMTIFRENTEDIYAGIEFRPGSPEAEKFLGFLRSEFPEQYAKIRFTKDVGLGVKPVSKEGTQRLVRQAIRYAIENKKKVVTLVHKGNIMKFTEGAFRDWGYEVADTEFGAMRNEPDNPDNHWRTIVDPASGHSVVINDVIVDAMLQQVLLRPAEYEVIATLNLNGDLISDELAAEVGGIGIAPGANINYETGMAMFEATHGTAPKYAGQDKVNPSSVILSGEMMLRYMGWTEAAELIIRGIVGALEQKRVTYDFHRLMEGATLVKCSEFGQSIIDNMD